MCEHASKFSSVDGFGEELDELVYEGMSNWFVSFRPFLALFSAHFSYLIVHISIIVCGLLTLNHARMNGSRFLQFWWGAMIHGILSESGLMATKYWHAQAAVMLFGKRLPLHMVFFYPSMLYMAIMGVQKFKLSTCCESIAVGIMVMLMEIPFRVISVRFLHITYHDSDPTYASKFYGVPWVEIFSALVFATSYTASYYALKHHFLSENHVKWEKVEYEKKEAMVTAASGMVSPLLAFFKKVIFFHFLHDSFNVNPPTCLFFLFTIHFSVLFCREGSRQKQVKERHVSGKVLLYYAFGVYMACLLYVAMLCRPQNEISVGIHEPTGDCTTLICTRSPLGKVLKRRKYLCVDEVQERSNFVYGFTCLPDGPPYLNAIWYTLCGTAIRNRAQFLTNIFSFMILISSIFLKGLLTDQEIERIKRRLPSIESLLRFLKERRRRAAAETFGRLETSSVTKSPSYVGNVSMQRTQQPVPSSDTSDRSEHDL